jgi:hypothetical protein
MNDQTHLGKRVKFSIYTEDLQRPQIIALVHKEFAAATLYSAQGSWKGQQEQSLVIEVITHESSRGAVHNIAYNIKRLNSQEAVMVVESPIETMVMI